MFTEKGAREVGVSKTGAAVGVHQRVNTTGKDN